MIIFYKKIIFSFIIFVIFFIPNYSFSEDIINLDGPSLLPRAELFISPRTGNFIVGSTFEAPIYVNTLGNDINAISVKLKFDPKKLSIIKPSGGRSIFGIWVEPPSYDNQKGSASLIGVVPDGIVSSSGLIATVTFKVISSGETNISITDDSSANLNDGLGTNVKLVLGKSFYYLTPKTPDGVLVFSDTHPVPDHWYNNNSPILRWERTENTEGFNILIDNNPGSIPETKITTYDTLTSYENLKDGVWYFHVREKNKGIWGSTSHFQVKIDTIPPAEFKSEVNILEEKSGIRKYSLSFFTTDSLSNISHYEVGVINKDVDGDIASPVFIETESPYVVPNTNNDKSRVIIRAFDYANNMRESYVDLYPGYTFVKSFKKYGAYLLIILIIFMLFELVIHYLFGHHLLHHIKKAYSYFRNISDTEDNPKTIGQNNQNNTEKPL